MKKFNDLDEEEKSTESDKMYSCANMIEKVTSKHSLSGFGICSECSYFEFAESEFRIEFAKCGEFFIRRTQNIPIKNCSNFNKKGIMSIRDMQNIAIIIELPKEEVGF